MAEESTQPTEAAGVKTVAAIDPSLRAAVLGTCVAVWILAVFMITSINAMREDVSQIRTTTESVLIGVNTPNLAGMRVVDSSGAEVYSLQPALAPEGQEEVCAQGSGGGTGACGTKASTCGDASMSTQTGKTPSAGSASK